MNGCTVPFRFLPDPSPTDTVCPYGYKHRRNEFLLRILQIVPCHILYIHFQCVLPSEERFKKILANGHLVRKTFEC